MSTLEPKTTARVLIHTTKGPLLVGIWARELPLVSRSFLQKCIDGFYDGQAFTTISESLVATSCTSSFEFRDEFHSRIRFSGQGTLGFFKKDENARHANSTDSFFISLKELPQYNNRYIAFGKLLDNSFYNVVTIRDSELGDDGKPLYPVLILSVEVLEQYFEDLIPKQQESTTEPIRKKPKPSKPKVVQTYDEDDNEGGDGDSPELVLKSVHELNLNKALVDKKDHLTSNSPHDNSSGSLRLKRDPTIDSDFDERLDLLSDDETWDPKTLSRHIFTPCA